ncbi:MAG: hypothetical protein CM1200mP16_04720 [Nitrospina sp.]|nr:MAG: hypothetical protein CM1200mP16_04720 [Nitrospina sp.]
MKEEYDAVVLCGGSQKPRDLLVEGRNLDGIHYAMEFLPQQNKRNEGDVIPNDIFITAKDKNVLIIGGGDTGSDCVGHHFVKGLRASSNSSFFRNLLAHELIIIRGHNGRKFFGFRPFP